MNTTSRSVERKVEIESTNRTSGVSGTFYYDPTLDIIRFQLPRAEG